MSRIASPISKSSDGLQNIVGSLLSMNGSLANATSVSGPETTTASSGVDVDFNVSIMAPSPTTSVGPRNYAHTEDFAADACQFMFDKISAMPTGMRNVQVRACARNVTLEDIKSSPAPFEGWWKRLERELGYDQQPKVIDMVIRPSHEAKKPTAFLGGRVGDLSSRFGNTVMTVQPLASQSAGSVVGDVPRNVMFRSQKTDLASNKNLYLPKEVVFE